MRGGAEDEAAQWASELCGGSRVGSQPFSALPPNRCPVRR